MILTSLGLMAVISIFSVNWIRQMTMGRDAAPGLGLNLGGRHLRFAFVMIVHGGHRLVRGVADHQYGPVAGRHGDDRACSSRCW